MENRRDFLQTAGVAGLGLMFATQNANAQTPESDKLVVTTEISNNHRHELVLTQTDVVKLIRQANATGNVQTSIQGQSGHPHAIAFSVLSLVNLIVGGSITLTSSTDAGHSHTVAIKLDVVP